MARFAPERKRPWIIPAIVVVAIVVVVVGLIVTVAAGGRIF
ncbi:hypothetical protein [Leifsonia shinshuensis]|nr:hypothetical protein [Leifsonia shinshuensis]MDR6969721.1 t-SNARE complex subunit (syntaxin) [Leifsonia shinshuensis]